VQVLMGEPFAYTSLLPWQNLYFWYTATHLRSTGQLARNAIIMPCRGVLRGQAVQFDHLWKCHSDIGMSTRYLCVCMSASDCELQDAMIQI
ncbi:hypothetical protein SARC_17415, partial [Sphaeroforma arctica JP610]